MATTLGDLIPSDGRAPMKRRDVTLPEAVAEAERLDTELAHARARVQQLEEELREARRLEAVGRLAGGVAHDFSNILAVISGYSELMLKRMDPTDPLRTGAESIRKAAVWGLNLTQHMLTSSRAAAPPAPSLLDLNAVVSGVVRTLAPLLGDAIVVAQTLDPRLGRVRVDAGQLEQALVNLVLNARDAMPSGGRLTIETGNADLEQAGGGRLRAAMVRLTDTGCGMDAATLSRAFEPYFTTKPPGRGTGLGLATVFAFVSQIQGHIEATSEVGQGSTFTLYLPRQDAAAEPPAPAAGEPLSILVVEPEPDVRDLIGEILELHGYRVLTARDLDEALAASLAHQGALALVIADVLLPGAAGDGVLRRLGPARATARVLYLSGDLEDAVEQYHGVGAGRGFLHKPFTVEALVAKTREILGR
jgi:signal transduction histidine kinase/CheY-like chemotaxis protein